MRSVGAAVRQLLHDRADGRSDVASLRATFKAVGDEYVLNGEKCWITNASLAA